jgi:hypothetical protein
VYVNGGLHTTSSIFANGVSSTGSIAAKNYIDLYTTTANHLIHAPAGSTERDIYFPDKDGTVAILEDTVSILATKSDVGLLTKSYFTSYSSDVDTLSTSMDSIAVITIGAPGTYSIRARVVLRGSSLVASIGTERAAAFKLRRINNTAADIAHSQTVVNIDETLGYEHVEYGTIQSLTLPEVIYTTTNSNDIITIQGMLDIPFDAGWAVIPEANIVITQL